MKMQKQVRAQRKTWPQCTAQYIRCSEPNSSLIYICGFGHCIYYTVTVMSMAIYLTTSLSPNESAVKADLLSFKTLTSII